MTSATLAEALAARGFPCAVEARGTLAVLVPAAGVGAFADRDGRAEIVRMAREHGFTHVALELPRHAAQ